MNMTNYPHPIIAREGWPFLEVIGCRIALVTVLDGWCWSIPLWIIALFVLQFFRDPPREVPAGEKTVLSPADGRIVAIEPTQDPWLQARCAQGQRVHERVQRAFQPQPGRWRQ